MNYLRHGVKYILWLLLTLVLALVLIGIVKYNFDIKGYVEYLNTRNIDDVSLTNPMTIFNLFVPTEVTEPMTLEDLLEEEDNTLSGSVDVDIDFESFFGDFNQQDRASEVMSGEDFGFTTEPNTNTGEENVMMELTEEEQKQLFLEQLRLRELRMQQEAQMGTGQ